MKRNEIPVIILCGGEGSRLGELTKHTPKVMLEVEGRPFLYYVLKKYSKLGYKNVYLATGRLSDKIVRYPWEKLFPALEIYYHAEATPGIEKCIESVFDVHQINRAWVINGDTYITDWPSEDDEAFYISNTQFTNTTLINYSGYELAATDMNAGAEFLVKDAVNFTTWAIPGTYYDIGTPKRFERFKSYLREDGK